MGGCAARPGGRFTGYNRTMPALEEYFAERFGDRAGAEISRRRDAARTGIPATLEAIRAVLADR